MPALVPSGTAWAREARPGPAPRRLQPLIAPGPDRAFLRFDLSGVPPGARTTGAVLRLRLVASSGGGALPLEARPVLAPWSETSLAWGSQPATGVPSIVVPVGTDTTAAQDIANADDLECAIAEPCR